MLTGHTAFLAEFASMNGEMALGVIEGLGSGAWGIAEGSFHLLTSPIETMSGVVALAGALANDPEGVLEPIGRAGYERLASGGVRAAGQMMGETMAGELFGAGVAKGVSSLARRLGRSSTLVDDVIDAAPCSPGCFVAATLVLMAGISSATPTWANIEDVRIGDRVWTAQGGTTEVAEPHWAAEIAMVSEDGGVVDLSVLRPVAWFLERGVSAPGDELDLSLPELEVEGRGFVLSLFTPTIEEGRGRLVLTTVDRRSPDVYELGFEGGAVLRGTGGHPVYSVDRDTWVSVRDLQVGERLQTAKGAVTIEALEKVRGEHRVYNLEVEGDHEYLVGEAGVRAHNSSPCSGGAVNVGASTGSGGVFRIPRSVGAARHAIYDRLEGAIGRHGGELVEGGVRFPSRRAARQAASEIAGDMGSGARAIRASEFRGGPWSWRNSNGVIGRQSAEGRVLWRDDVLGHPQFGMGSHVNVEVDGIGLHLFY